MYRRISTLRIFSPVICCLKNTTRGYHEAFVYVCMQSKTQMAYITAASWL